ncbi:hypothetical protein H2200_006338 [Cladophialophora chaetospira]|uniref:SnoaL-like domain-containing protein n=1 Tax=Cladophialophora chaetospira TaxID=386627 RepID=A0AA38XBE8_9EURO|nr:hypothetical protein H2200_006338 [Cladophialophora chaetospira]
MPISTTPAFIHRGDWDENTRQDPSQKWMESIVRNIFDPHKWDTPYSDIYTSDDFILLKPDGTEVKGGERAWAEVAQLFGPLTSQKTIPFHLISTETDYGWEMVGLANIFGNLPGNPAEGEAKDQDQYGQEWDVKMSGGFRFQYKKVEGAKYDDILLQRVEIFTDSGPVVSKLVRRGVLKASDLGF